MHTPSPHRVNFFRRSLAAALLASGALLALNASLHAQTPYTYTNGGTVANTGSYQVSTNWSPNGIPSSTTTTSDTATFDGTGGGATAGTPLVLTDSTTDGGAGGNQGVILNLTAGQAGGLTLNDSASVRLAAGASSTSAAPTTAVTMAAGSGPLAISSVLIGGTSTAATFTSFVNNSSSTFSMANLQPGGGNTRTLNLLGIGNYAFTGAVQAANNTLNITKGVASGNTDGTGTLTISAANTYTGVTTINTGIVSISNSTALGAAGTAVNTGNTTTPTFTNTGDTLITSGTGSALNSGQLQLVGGTSGITVGETFVIGGRSSVANGGANAFDNISGANTLSGTVNFSTGGTDYGIRADAGSLTFSNGVTPFGGSKIFDITGNGGVVFSGVITDTATGTTSINRTAGFTGTLTLAGANTYTGATTINGGTLLVTNTSGSATGTGTVTLNTTGAITGGSGTSNGGTLQTLTTTGGLTATRQTYTPGILGIVGAVTVNTGNISPGAGGVGTLTVGALTLNAGTTATYEFNGAANDLISATGTLTLSTGTGAITLTLLQEGTSTAFATAGVYNLIKYAGGATVSTAGFTVANPQSGFSYAFSDDATDGLVQLDITAAAVPEPSTWAAGVLCLGVMSWVVRRRTA